MTPPADRELIETLAELRGLSPGVRFGQLLANLGFLAEDQTGRSLWDVEDEAILAVMRAHRADLARRQQPVA